MSQEVPKPREWPKSNKKKELKELMDLVGSPDCMLQSKRDGHFANVTITGHRKCPVTIHSRGKLLDWTEKFPSVVEEVRSMNAPGGTLVGVEMTVQVNGFDNATTFGSLSLSKPARSIEEQKKYSPVQVRIFNVVAYNNELVIGEPYRNRFEMIQKMTAKHSANVNTIEVLNMPLAEAQAHIIESELEGLVAYDLRAGSKILLEVDGKTPRPLGCWKWKPLMEDDFVATGWNPSGENPNLVKDLNIAQYNPSGQIVGWGVVGTGLSDELKRELAKARYPFVIQAGFEDRTPNNRLIFGRFIRIRDDKMPQECIFPRE